MRNYGNNRRLFKEEKKLVWPRKNSLYALVWAFVLSVSWNREKKLWDWIKSIRHSECLEWKLFLEGSEEMIQKTCEVYVRDALAGILAQTDEGYEFSYTQEISLTPMRSPWVWLSPKPVKCISQPPFPRFLMVWYRKVGCLTWYVTIGNWIHLTVLRSCRRPAETV